MFRACPPRSVPPPAHGSTGEAGRERRRSAPWGSSPALRDHLHRIADHTPVPHGSVIEGEDAHGRSTGTGRRSKRCRGIRVEQQRRVGLAAQDGRRANRGTGPLEGVPHRHRLALLRGRQSTLRAVIRVGTPSVNATQDCFQAREMPSFTCCILQALSSFTSFT